ncbi:transposase and inactivated derivatives [Candidatus Brocadia sinica JPN1]|uniref:Transposase and inactivated derivatives n=1 Tax=Candidatus Brocadia sinica JPN1 TaxID=1197129 RepID=A0ABQ0K0D0_9BACT|nr:transposase and inactivated derivatives [Candidatus Brocadia sinica JPN1]
MKDCEWIAQLPQHGLLNPGFVPPAPIRCWKNKRER